MHVPAQAVLQHTPSTHAPEPHCVALVQVWPTVPRQLPLLQVVPAPHTRPQTPQFAGSVAVLTQLAPHAVCPALQHTPPGQATHTPPLHCAPAAQFALVVQVVVHALLPQMKGEQAFVVGVTQLPVPLPLQAEGGVSTPLVHDAAPQVVPAGVRRHALAPLHVPSLPQGGAGTQRVSVWPFKIGAQVPLA